MGFSLVCQINIGLVLLMKSFQRSIIQHALWGISFLAQHRKFTCVGFSQEMFIWKQTKQYMSTTLCGLWTMKLQIVIIVMTACDLTVCVVFLF